MFLGSPVSMKSPVGNEISIHAGTISKFLWSVLYSCQRLFICKIFTNIYLQDFIETQKSFGKIGLQVAVGLVVALNYQNPFLNPYEEFQVHLDVSRY